jgi:hypothetical protein
MKILYVYNDRLFAVADWGKWSRSIGVSSRSADISFRGDELRLAVAWPTMHTR